MRILQIGTRDWSDSIELPEDMEWQYVSDTTLAIEETTEPLRTLVSDESISDESNIPMMMPFNKWIKSFQAILIEREEGFTLLESIKEVVQPYTIFYNEHIPTAAVPHWCQLYGAFPLTIDNSQQVVILFSKVLFKSQYGDKLSPVELIVHPKFNGTVIRNSRNNLELSGDFGEDFRPIAFYKYNRLSGGRSVLELWQEYEKEGECELRLRIRRTAEGSTDHLVSDIIATEDDMKDAIVLDEPINAFFAVTVEIKGTGTVKVGALHARYSRMQFGKYTLGGHIISDSKRQELNYFFHPGDMKPPLCVYFSGWRAAGGFEGYGMMKQLGKPFLLLSEQRMTGGAFYMGTPEYEQNVVSVIQKYRDLLGFSNQELIFSGLSMGTYGSLYYASEFNPHAVIIAKPLTNLGTMAVLTKTFSPGSFPTSLDLMQKMEYTLGTEEAQRLDQRFWDKFNQGNYQDTTFAVVYMSDDDYDPIAYQRLVENLQASNARIFGKKLEGRHNDGIDAAIGFFNLYYREILKRYDT